MSEIEQKIQELKVKKARQFFNIESLSEVNDSTYLQFGKTVAELMKLEKLLVRETKNHFDEN
jgi:hypothetical protein